jgi:hypothetical protein
MQSKAATVAQYLAELPADRRTAIEAVRQVILKNLDKDYEEGMQYGMIGYYVPHRVFPAGYHCDPKQPLPFAALASQKNHMAVYLMSVYGEDEELFRAAWAKTGKKLDMGKCCVRFKKLEDVPLPVIGDAIKRYPAKKFIEMYLNAVDTRSKGSPTTTTKKASAKKATAASAPPKKAQKKAPVKVAKKTVKKKKG